MWSNIPDFARFLELLLSAGIGGGLFSLFHYRLKKRKLKNEISMQEYTNLDEALTKFSTRMLSMMEQIEGLSSRALALSERLEQEKIHVTQLTSQIHETHEKLRQYEAFLREVRDRCTCDDDFLAKIDNI